MSALLTFDSVALNTPDGRALFSGLTLSITRERIGLVGRNGAGKSSLLRRILNGDPPDQGSIALTASVGTMEQVPARDSGCSVSDALCIASAISAIRAAEAGEFQPGIEIDWEVEARAEAALARAGLSGMVLDRALPSLSGGELTRLAIARLWLERPQLLLLDEPTNTLDTGGREAIEQLIHDWPGGILTASHDRTLLEQMDRIVELSPTAIRITGGGWSAFEAARKAERAAADARLATAKSGVKTEAKTVRERAERKAKRTRKGKAARASRSQSKLVLNAEKQRSENSCARDAALGARKLAEAETELADARAAIDVLTPVAMDLPSSGLPAGRTLLDMRDTTLTRGHRRFGPWSLTITGPERVALTGANGAGKTTLLKLACGDLEPDSGEIRTAPARPAWLDQHVALLGHGSLLDAIRAANPALSDHQAHEMLARFGFRGSMAERAVTSLSGGERLRAGLACVMSADPVPELLILDEPTNHLDMEAVGTLEAALNAYDGALLVVSHDRPFLEAIAITREISLPRLLPLPARP